MVYETTYLRRPIARGLPSVMLAQTAKEVFSSSPFLRDALRRRFSTAAGSISNASLRRSYLYGQYSVFASYDAPRAFRICIPVPTSSDRMLEKSLTTNSDVIIYDLEDSVPPGTRDKENARQRMKNFFAVCIKLSSPADLIFNFWRLCRKKFSTNFRLQTASLFD